MNINDSYLNLMPGEKIRALIETSALNVSINHYKILDLGFGEPSSFFLLYDKYPFAKYIGIDKSKEISIELPWTKDLPLPEDLVDSRLILTQEDIYPKYLKFHKYNCNSNLISNNEFHATFDLQYNVDVIDYLKNTTKKFEIVVMSNLLHLKELRQNSLEIFHLALERTIKGGYIYLKVFTKPENENSKTIHFIQEEIDLFKSHFSSLIYEESHGNKSIFIGQK